jgi:hypothetical protein
MMNIAAYSHAHVKPIHGDFVGKDIVSLDQFAAEDFFTIFDLALKMKQLVACGEPAHFLAGKVI